MIIYPKVTTPPAEEPVTLTQAKAQLKVTDTTEDTLITRLITVARQMCEADSGRSFITQERTVKLDRFPCGDIILPYGPVQDVDDFTYIDTAGVEQTLTVNTHYKEDLHSDIARLRAVDSWPQAKDEMNSVTVVYTAGYGDAADVPECAKQAILQQLASLHQNREDETNGPLTLISWHSRRLLDPIRVDHYAWAD
jgi:uncharacterized phiE125 gp8 family phage protein